MTRRSWTAAIALPLLALTAAPSECGSAVSDVLAGGGSTMDCSDNMNVVTCPSYRNCPHGESDCSSMDSKCNGTPVKYICVTKGGSGPYCCPSAGAPCNHAYDCCPGLSCNMHVCSTSACDKCGAAGSWTFSCSGASGCGVCGTIPSSKLQVTIPDSVAMMGGTFQISGETFTFDLASCSVDLGQSACGISVGKLHFSATSGAYFGDTQYRCADDCSTCGDSHCPGTR